ncbi:glycosyltransferase family 9 protein [Anatilimnocola floriformis]|uniref:glycosyltransferase family 9 protein n=1 Tax=Anatilimnocola floriformis TaxID=2948575 RepID=UPI0020C52B50|nr:glycosyltransferase family 9 protein [Anatilimnocola floriformis]
MTAESQPRFLITRLSAIGDCVLTMPLACALRDAFPHAWIGWVAEKAGGSLLQGHAAIDQVIIAPKGVLKSPRKLWTLRKELQALRPDITLDPQGLLKSSVLGWLSGAKRRIGFRPPVGRERSHWFNNDLIQSTERHVVGRYRQLLTRLDVDLPPVRFDLPRPVQNQRSIAAWLYSQNLADKPMALINPGAGWDSKLWPADRFAAVARYLESQQDLRTVVVWAGELERVWAKQIVAQSNGAAILAPSTSLPDLAELARHATMFVGSDTGPLHMAAAVGVPCVGIYGPTDPADCGPFGPHHRTVQAFLQTGSSRERREAENIAMRAVTVEQVTAACHEVLRATRRQLQPIAA